MPDAREKLRQRIEAVLSRPEFPVSACLFGSSVNNLGVLQADVDLTLIPVPKGNPSQEDETKEFTTLLNTHPLKNVRKIAALFRKDSRFRSVQAISNARVPICKFYDTIEKLQCDVNFGHSLGVKNSELLKAYTDLDPRIQPLILLVKYWAKAKGINDPSNGSISSYAWSIMVLSFMMDIGELVSLQNPKLEILQSFARVADVARGKGGTDRVVDVSACYSLQGPIIDDFKRSISKYQGSYLWNGPSGVTDLLCKFFGFLGYEYTYQANHALSIGAECGVVIVNNPNSCKLKVLDPFEETRNCTSMVQSKLPHIIQECRNAYLLLSKGKLIFDS